MKIRNGFVTNSSSSSFIIASKDVDYEFLLHTVLKDLFIEQKKWFYYDEDEEKTDGEIEEELAEEYSASNVLAGNGNIVLRSMTREEYEDEFFSFKLNSNIEKDEKIYVVDNDDGMRYDFSEVDEIVTEKHGIPYVRGYCD